MICLPTAWKPAASFGRRGLPFLSRGKPAGSKLLSQSLKVRKRIFSATWAITGSFLQTVRVTFSSSFSVFSTGSFFFPSSIFYSNLPYRRLFKRPSPERSRSDLQGLCYRTIWESGLTDRLWGLMKASRGGKDGLTVKFEAFSSKWVSAGKAKSSVVYIGASWNN